MYPSALRNSGNTLRVSLAYNAAAVTVEAQEHITPLAAALLMPASSLSVIAVAVSRRFSKLAVV